MMSVAEVSDINVVVGIFNAHTQAEAAVKKLQTSGFNMERLSIIGRDYHAEDNVVGYYNTGDQMKYWGKMGNYWDGFWRLLFGFAFFVVPGIGPVVVGGPLVVWIVGALESAALVHGMGAFGAALYSVGIPKESIHKYESCLKANYFILVAHDSADEAEHAYAVLQTSMPVEVEVHRELNVDAC